MTLEAIGTTKGRLDMAAAGRTDDCGHGNGDREDPGGREVERVPARAARRVWGQAVVGALSAGGLAAAAFALALVLAAPAGPAGATTSSAKTVKVATAKVAGVGTVLTTASGLTLYRFADDTPGTSMCTGACAKAWPPLLAAKGAHIAAPHGVKGLTLLRVGNGHWQVALDKLPLYRFAGDKKKGQAHGQNVAGTWFAVLKSGIPASALSGAAGAGAAATSTTTPGAPTTQPVTPTTTHSSGGASTGAKTTVPTPAPAAVPTTPATSTPATTPATTPVTSAPAPAPAPPPTTPTTSSPPPTTPTTSPGGGGYGY
jgi:predicted lipoprotein with Yx(FWY)xxD motif